MSLLAKVTLIFETDWAVHNGTLAVRIPECTPFCLPCVATGHAWIFHTWRLEDWQTTRAGALQQIVEAIDKHSLLQLTSMRCWLLGCSRQSCRKASPHEGFRLGRGVKLEKIRLVRCHPKVSATRLPHWRCDSNLIHFQEQSADLSSARMGPCAFAGCAPRLLL